MTDRVIVWAGQIPLETDVLRSNKFAMTGIAKLAAAVLGTSATVVNGLAAVPTAPATLTVNVNPGEIYSLVSMDATAYSSVAADTTHQIMKSGILLDAVNLSCPAPGTAGQSINYLIEAIYQDSDTDLTTLPYYNASNPSSAWSGPNNSGTPQATTRKGTVALVAKAGAAATTGSQTTPAPDAGYTGLWVVTVANGQTQIIAGNITQYAGAPILPSSLLASIQNGNLAYAVATGTANAHVVALTPALQQRVDGMVIRYKAPAANTGALTLNDGLGAIAVVGAAHAALQGGETVTNGDVWVQWNSSVGGGSYIMLDSSGGALQVAPATQSAHAVQFAQLTGTIGTFRNLASALSTGSGTVAYTADQVVVGSALNGLQTSLASLNASLTVGTVGIGGLDTGTTLTANSYYAVYAAYNPTTQASGVFASLEVSGGSPTVYGGANRPSGYTQTALIGILHAASTSTFAAFAQVDRDIDIIDVTLLTTSSTTSGAFSLSSAIPQSARMVNLGINISQSGGTNVSLGCTIASNSALVGAQLVQMAANTLTQVVGYVTGIKMTTRQQAYYAFTSSGAGTNSLTIYTSGYRF